MITESELEAQGITWFQHSGWESRHGAGRDMPEGAESGNPCLSIRLSIVRQFSSQS